MFKNASKTVICRKFCTSSIPGNVLHALLVSIEIVRSQHIVLEDGVVGITRAGGSWRCCDSDHNSALCQSCRKSEDPEQARAEALGGIHVESNYVVKPE